MKKTIPIHYQISPYLVFFLVHSNQVGVGIIGFQRIIAKKAGHDAWMSILIAGMFVHFIIWMIYKMLESCQGDIVDVQLELFGKWIGNIFNLLIVLYFILQVTATMRTYFEIIQVWMFPTLQTWVLTLIFLALAYYTISGGFRVVVGICFFSVILPFPIFFTIGITLKYAHIVNLLPIFNHTISQIALSAKDSTYTFAGFETLLLYYPFIREASSSQKYAHFGTMLSVSMYVVATIFTFLFFSQRQLQHTIWPMLAMSKIMTFPFLQRFEYFAISFFSLAVMSNIILPLWGASRAVKKVFHIHQKYTFLAISLLVLLISVLIREHYVIQAFSKIISDVEFYFLVGYIPLLTCIYLLSKRRKQNATN